MLNPRDQRLRSRVRLDLPVRIRQIGPPRSLIEVARTLDISRNGLLFRTREKYDPGATVWVTMHYSPGTASPDPEFPATVVRVDRKPEGGSEVAVQFHSARADEIRSAAPPPAPMKSQERRDRSRVRMALPIRLRHGVNAEESITFDVSRAGVLVETARSYPVGQTVWVLMPYQPGVHGEEVPARVVRHVERLRHGGRGVALHFTPSTLPRGYSRIF